MDPINVIFDIDGTLCGHSVGDDKKNRASFYLRHGAILSAIKTHFIFPGVIEFLQRLFSDERYQVSFFTSGREDRTPLFVEKLVTLAIGKEEYKKTNIKYLSRPNLVPDNKISLEAFKESALDYIGKKVKDISKLVGHEHLPNTAFIEDDISYVHPGQEGNLIKVDYTDRESKF